VKRWKSQRNGFLYRRLSLYTEIVYGLTEKESFQGYERALDRKGKHRFQASGY
jgi:hypothetical protein